MKFTLSWLKEHLETDADAQPPSPTSSPPSASKSKASRMPARALKDFVVAHVVIGRETSQRRQAEALHGR